MLISWLVVGGLLACHHSVDPVPSQPEASPWPADLAPQYHPEGVRKALAAAFPEGGDVRVVAIECDEYPCVVLLTSETADARLNAALHEVPEFTSSAMWPVEASSWGDGAALATAISGLAPDSALVPRVFERLRAVHDQAARHAAESPP